MGIRPPLEVITRKLRHNPSPSSQNPDWLRFTHTNHNNKTCDASKLIDAMLSGIHSLVALKKKAKNCGRNAIGTNHKFSTSGTLRGCLDKPPRIKPISKPKTTA
jgi:hypothetical protein